MEEKEVMSLKAVKGNQSHLVSRKKNRSLERACTRFLAGKKEARNIRGRDYERHGIRGREGRVRRAITKHHDLDIVRRRGEWRGWESRKPSLKRQVQPMEEGPTHPGRGHRARKTRKAQTCCRKRGGRKGVMGQLKRQ